MISPAHCGGISVCRWSPTDRPIGVVERCPELGQVDRVDRSDPWDEHGIGPGNIPQPAGQPDDVDGITELREVDRLDRYAGS